MGHIARMGAYTFVCKLYIPPTLYCSTCPRNSTAPRLASPSKDGTVRVWSTSTRHCEYTLGGHTASVNVVRWGGGGLNGKGVLYTASSDRTVRVWDANGGKPLHTLKDHAHWVTTLTLNTDFVLRTGPYDHTGKKPASDNEGMIVLRNVKYPNVLSSVRTQSESFDLLLKCLGSPLLSACNPEDFKHYPPILLFILF